MKERKTFAVVSGECWLDFHCRADEVSMSLNGPQTAQKILVGGRNEVCLIKTNVRQMSNLIAESMNV